MSATMQPSSVQTLPGAVPPDSGAVPRRGSFKRALFITLSLVLIIALTYAFAWLNAYRLSARFIRDADDNYAQENYLEALVGGDKFDPQTNRNIKLGGYLDVEKIWSDRYSWPTPAILEHARSRTQEIVDQRLTIETAEDYIRANTGRPAPYFAEIYLRIGELYEEEGDLLSARDVYESIPELFPNRPDLIEKANSHLERLSGS